MNELTNECHFDFITAGLRVALLNVTQLLAFCLPLKKQKQKKGVAQEGGGGGGWRGEWVAAANQAQQRS